MALIEKEVVYRMQAYQKNFIHLAIAHQALRFGEFTLKSGRKSPYFFNVGQLSSGQALKTLGECYAQAIRGSQIPFDVLFGPAYKGIPLVCAASIGLETLFQQDVPYAFNRKEAKDHGEGGNIVGASLKGRVLVLDDVITAGTAIRESCQLIEACHGKVAGILVALDRQEKGQSDKSALQEMQRLIDAPVTAIITFDDIVQYIKQDPGFSDFGKPLADYRNQYGI